MSCAMPAKLIIHFVYFASEGVILSTELAVFYTSAVDVAQWMHMFMAGGLGGAASFTSEVYIRLSRSTKFGSAGERSELPGGVCMDA
jgi:hypothetical protein